MKSCILVSTILLFGVSAYSDVRLDRNSQNRRLVEQARQTAIRVGVEAPWLNQAQVGEVSRLLQEIDNVLNESGYNEREIRCVSRDNDGRNPWVLSVREGVTDLRIPGTHAATRETCLDMKSSIQVKNRMSLVCVSRDNDGLNPWMVTAIDARSATLQTFDRTIVFNTRAECQTGINDAVPNSSGLSICASRDKDGKTPFLQFLISRGGEIQSGNESFRSYSDCVSDIIGAGR